MITATLPPNPNLADRFSWLLGTLVNAIGVEARRLGIAGPLEAAIGRRIWGLWKRLKSVFAKWQAGTLGPPRAARGTSSPPSPQNGEGEAPAERPPRPPSVLPRRWGWLKRLLPDIAHNMNPFSDLLDDPNRYK
jgi:hypothetical protein